MLHISTKQMFQEKCYTQCFFNVKSFHKQILNDQQDPQKPVFSIEMCPAAQ